MKIATWNVNSIKIRLPQILDWLKNNPVDILCLQELKISNEMFPIEDFKNISYHSFWSGQKSYNGVAILSQKPGTDITYEIPNYDDNQKRFIALTILKYNKKIRIVCVYCPNGQSINSDKYTYKLQWFEALHSHLKVELQNNSNLAVLGDYNIAPSDADVYYPKKLEGEILVSKPERDAFNKLLKLGLYDAFRLFNQPEKSFSWWDYRRGAFHKNIGLRIDLILLSRELHKTCTSCVIDKSPRFSYRPSDHVPIIATLDFT